MEELLGLRAGDGEQNSMEKKNVLFKLNKR